MILKQKAQNRNYRNAEKHWLRHKTETNHDKYCTLRNEYKRHLENNKTTYVREKVTSCSSDSRALYRTVAGLIGSTKSKPLPESTSDVHLAGEFAHYYYDKIDTIRSELEHHPLYEPPHRDVTQFKNFTAMDDEKVSKIIMKSKPTTCHSDPIPSSLIKMHCDIFTPIIRTIINASFSSSDFHTSWKNALVKPLLKQGNTGKVISHYRPVSNLPYLSKLAEKASMLSFNQHLNDNNLLPDYQSAYRALHSTETLLVKLFNDLLENFESKRLTPLISIDLSAAFDTVNHDLLLRIMESSFGVCEEALEWTKSYLTGRSFAVGINNNYSDPISLDFSVPQGSINGPIYFSCYASTIDSAITENLQVIGYADDHCIYGSYAPGDDLSEHSMTSSMLTTVNNIKQWMCANRLQMNDSKTELVVFGSQAMLTKCHISEIVINESIVYRSDFIKLLGVRLDQHLTLKDHITSKARIAAQGMYNLMKLRKYLDITSSLKIANSLIFSHMDYANSLFVNLPKSTLWPLQRVQNQTAKIILGRSKFSSSTDALKQLHILPIHVRVEYKLVVLVFKCLHHLAPPYLANLIRRRESHYKTRSAGGCFLHVPFTRASTFRDRSFSVAGPKLWNDLPDDVKNCVTVDSFKSKLKTHLFERTFN